jgi:hypothetical protein
MVTLLCHKMENKYMLCFSCHAHYNRCSAGVRARLEHGLMMLFRRFDVHIIMAQTWRRLRSTALLKPDPLSTLQPAAIAQAQMHYCNARGTTQQAQALTNTNLQAGTCGVSM